MRTVRVSAIAAMVLAAGAFLLGCAEPPGAKIFKRERCLTCHSINAKGGGVGPNLARVGGRRTRDYIIRHVKDPQSINPNTAMPAYPNLPAHDLNELADYLSSLK